MEEVIEIGTQYKNDERLDSSGFLKEARYHQSRFRCDYLKLNYNKFGSHLTREDAANGFNFYNSFGIFDAVKKRPYSDSLYANMLRSEHIPYNLFIPLNNDLVYCSKVFNEILNKTIYKISPVIIEHSPRPSKNYLNDRTSFDFYFVYIHMDGSKGAIGIEVKYTEREYKLKPDSAEALHVNNPDSIYYKITNQSDIYKFERINNLKDDNFRQLWRNQLLGETILLKEKNIKYFTSIINYPKTNSHFEKICKKYKDLLQDKFISITYEEYLSICKQHCPSNDFLNWIEYLKKRYIVGTY
ncbi:MAG: PGN_0703 family putative restriction endonuclease [Syntrophothermus sp.]